LFAGSFHKIFLVLPNPVITKGEVVNLETTAQYYSIHYHNIRIVTQIVEFDYEGKRYRIIAGSDESDADIGRIVDVIFSRSNPQNAAEFSVEGFLDFPLAKVLFYIWIFATGGLLAMARLNAQFRILVFDSSKITLTRLLILLAVLIALPFISLHFISFSGIGLVFVVAIFWETKVVDPNEDTTFSTLFNFNLYHLTVRNAFLIAIPILLIPLIPHATLLLAGVKTHAIVTNQMVFANDGHPYRAAVYTIDHKEYKAPIQDYDYDKKEMIGYAAPVIYLPSRPSTNSLYTFHALYVNNWTIPMGMALILLVAWFFATRIPNDEGTMDE
jgi:hypothetical protein